MFFFYMCREAATTEDDTGIEGILNRLEKQRNLTFGFNLKEKEDDVFFPSTYKFPEISTDAVSLLYYFNIVCVFWWGDSLGENIMQSSNFSLVHLTHTSIYLYGG